MNCVDMKTAEQCPLCCKAVREILDLSQTASLSLKLPVFITRPLDFKESTDYVYTL